MNDILEKYEKDLFANIDKDNLNNIILFLYRENCDYIEDIIEDYLDLFIIPYEQFVDMYSLLNKKYNMEFLKKTKKDMNLLEEFYN